VAIRLLLQLGGRLSLLLFAQRCHVLTSVVHCTLPQPYASVGQFPFTAIPRLHMLMSGACTFMNNKKHANFSVILLILSLVLSSGTQILELAMTI